MPIQFRNINQTQPTSFTKKCVIYAGLFFIMVSPAVAIAASPTGENLANNTQIEASPDPSPSPEDEELLSPEVIQKNKERLQRALQNQSEKIKGVLDELGSRKKGMVGEVQRVSETSITIKTNKATQIIAMSPNTKINKGTRGIDIDDIAVGEWAIVVSSEEDDTLVPELVNISTVSLRPNPQIVTLGSVTSINALRTQLTVQTRAESEEKTFVLNRNTQYEDVNGNPAKVTNLSEDVQVLVVAQEESDGVIVSRVRLLVPLTQ